MTLDSIKLILAEICAPYRKEGRNVMASITVSDFSGKAKYDFYVSEHFKNRVETLFSRYVVPEDQFAQVLELARDHFAQIQRTSEQDTARLAAVLGIPYVQAAAE